MIPPDDRGFTLGDGLFETVLAEDGDLVRPDAHLDRLTDGCASLGLPAPDRPLVLNLMRQALADSGLGEARAAVRLTLTAGSGGRGLDRPAQLQPRLVATAAAAPRPTTPARLVTAAVRRNDQSPAARLKTLSYLDNALARAEALTAGADEALMLNTRGELACAAAANLFWIDGGKLFTPALNCGVLAGTARARVLTIAAGLGVEVCEIRSMPGVLAAAEAVFLTNALFGLRPVAEVDGRAFAPHRQAEQIARVLEA